MEGIGHSIQRRREGVDAPVSAVYARCLVRWSDIVPVLMFVSVDASGGETANMPEAYAYAISS